MSALAESVRVARRGLRFADSWSARIGVGVAGAILLLALFGPFFAPHSPNAIAGIPYTTPNADFPIGTDFLGRDALSRLLWGGRSLVGLALLSTTIAYVIGGAVGLLAGHSRTFVSPTLMRAMDVLLAFPPLLLLLLLIVGLGPSVVSLVTGIIILHVPGVARIVYAATLETSVRGYVEAAEARGEPLRYVLGREILPNITGPIAADAGPRLTVSILAVAALNFLGLGLQPPAADWALMISENRGGLSLQPWALVVPALLIALLTIAVNLVADAVARRLGTSIDEELIRR